MTIIIIETPMKLLGRFIFVASLTDSVFGMPVYVQIHVAIIFSLNYFSGVTASVDKSVCISKV